MRVISQRAEGDCGIAALAMLTGVAYEDAYVAVARIDRVARGKSGLCLKDLVQAAARLGVSLRHRRMVDLDDDEGILNVIWNDKRAYRGHYVVLYRGVIVDPGGPEILPHDEWLARNNGRPATLLEVL